jgi:hypothetical protein
MLFEHFARLNRVKLQHIEKLHSALVADERMPEVHAAPSS